MTVRSIAATPRFRLLLGGAALFLAGAIGGTALSGAAHPTIEMAPITQTPIGRLADGNGVVSVHGTVSELFGDRFMLQDASGHALVDAGPESRRLRVGRPITVQGHFGRGELHARFLVAADNSVREVPPPPPPGGPGPHPGTMPPPTGGGMMPPPPPVGPGPLVAGFPPPAAGPVPPGPSAPADGTRAEGVPADGAGPLPPPAGPAPAGSAASPSAPAGCTPVAPAPAASPAPANKPE